MFNELPRRNFNTQQIRLSVIMLTTIGYAISPILFASYMFQLLEEGAFPPESDSIGIPIGGFVLLWLLFWPFFILACYLFEKLGKKIERNGQKSISPNRAAKPQR